MLKFSSKKILRFGLLGSCAVGIIISSLFLAQYITQSSAAQEIVAQMGYTGVLLVAIISGLNSIAPVPPATFVPIFTAAGLVMPIILVMLILGTTIADLAGYVFGKWSKNFVLAHYPKTYTYIQQLRIENKLLLFFFVLTYASIVPFPNEAFIIPFALMGIPLYRFIFPMVLGTTIYHITTTYGVISISQMLF